MMRKVLFIAVFALLYTAGAAWSMVFAISATLSGVESSASSASLAIRFFDLLTQGMMFPLVPLIAPHGAMEAWRYHVLIFCNGVLWGIALVVLWLAATRRRLRRPAGSPAA